MKISLDIRLVPALFEAVGKKRLEFEFEGKTVGDMIKALVVRYGSRAREALYDSRGDFDGMIQVILNSKKWIRSDKLDTPLKSDDSVSLMLLIAGG